MEDVEVAVELEHEVLLGGEVVVGAAQRDARSAGDRPHRGRLVAVGAKQLEGGFEDSRPRLPALCGPAGVDHPPLVSVVGMLFASTCSWYQRAYALACCVRRGRFQTKTCPRWQGPRVRGTRQDCVARLWSAS